MTDRHSVMGQRLLVFAATVCGTYCLFAEGNAMSKIDAMRRLYKGSQARTWEELSAYTGSAAVNAIVGGLRQRAYMLNYEQLAVNYGETADFQLRREQVVLCPQTEEFLYTKFTPTTVTYRKGSRPSIEEVVRKATSGRETDQEKALALMRFCRDLHRKNQAQGFEKYVFGGAEEQLIQKGEMLCECLGRLFVALCEVAGIPARVVMHDIGGHIAAEAYVGGKWGYVDPTTGIYCLKPDGKLASTWEMWQEPSLLQDQNAEVKADTADRWTWEERAKKCETKYFHIEEINGFENYTLRNASRYNYGQLTYSEADAAGLFVVNKFYCAAADRVFGKTGDIGEYIWPDRKLRKIPLAYRHDGFSTWFREPPVTRADVERTFVDPFKDTNVGILVWGVGPGSVFCFDTKVGEIFGEGVSEAQWKLLRKGDRWVYENVTRLIKSGSGPLRIAVQRGHEIAMKVFARLEMNHEYGPPDPKNWLWIAFVGKLNKEHPEYRIPGTVLLDFKHKGVRDFKLAILREAAELGADGVSLDFAVYPPFFEKPNAEIMTGFIRDVRTMLNDVGLKQGRQLELMVRVPTPEYERFGLDWKAWMREGLIDIVVPADYHGCNHFDCRVADFVRLGHETGCKVYGCVWHSLGFVDTDPRPDGKQRYDKPKTKGMFYSQALLYHREGVDGIQLAMSAGEWNQRPWYNDLADPTKVELADKHYMLDPKPYLPIRFAAPTDRSSLLCNRLVLLRIGDDIAHAREAGYAVEATLAFYSRDLLPGEKLEIYVNGQGPLLISGEASKNDQKRQAGADAPNGGPESVAYQRDWWKRGEKEIKVEPDWWKLGTNTIRFAYSGFPPEKNNHLSISWVDLLLKYRTRK